MKIIRKKYLVVINLISLVTLVIVFYPHRLSNYISNSDVAPNECIIGRGDLAENYTLPKVETEEILSLMDETSVRFLGFNKGIVLDTDEHTYNLLLINRSRENLTELGSFNFDENGCVYTMKYKYKILGKNEIISMIKRHLNK
ncbi:MAG: hypothetical protein RR048_01795 [Oscillospiraceae bacterium]